MADPQYHDADGNPITVSAQPQFHDSEGKPISQQQFQSPLPTDNTIGRHLVEALPFAGSVAGSTLGPLGTTAGIGLGTMVKQALQKARPDLLGEAPSGAIDIGVDLGKEILLNQTLPWGVGKLGGLATQIGMQGPAATAALRLSNFPAVREGVVSRMTEQIKGMLGDYKPLGDVTPIKISENTIPYQPIEITPGQDFKAFGGKGKPFQMPTKPTVGVSGPEKQVPEGTYSVIPGMVKKGEDKLSPLLQGSHIDASKALEEMSGPNAARYADAMPPETYGAVRNLLGTMKDMQKKTTLDRIITYRQGRLVWGAGMGALAALGHPGTALLGEGLREGPVVLNSMLGKIMENPETAKLVTAALQTPAKAPQADLINKALQVALPRLFLEGAGISTVPER